MTDPKTLRDEFAMAAKQCSVCIGGWRGYWRDVLSGEYAPVCEYHQEENARSAALARKRETEE